MGHADPVLELWRSILLLERNRNRRTHWGTVVVLVERQGPPRPDNAFLRLGLCRLWRVPGVNAMNLRLVGFVVALSVAAAAPVPPPWVQVRRVPDAAVDRLLGSGKSDRISLYLVTVCLGSTGTRSRVAVLGAVPELAAFPNDIARTYIQERATRDRRSRAVRFWTLVVDVGPIISQTVGFAADSKEGFIAATALSVIKLVVVPMLKPESPDPTKWNPLDLLPMGEVTEGQYIVVAPSDDAPDRIGPVPIP